MDEFPYEMLEELKDGKAESIKYNSIKLQVNTPNTVQGKHKFKFHFFINYTINLNILSTHSLIR